MNSTFVGFLAISATYAERGKPNCGYSEAERKRLGDEAYQETWLREDHDDGSVMPEFVKDLGKLEEHLLLSAARTLTQKPTLGLRELLERSGAATHTVYEVMLHVLLARSDDFH